MTRNKLLPLLLAVLLGGSLLAPAALAQAPLGEDEEIAWAHAPYEVGDCSFCHENDDPDNPGGTLMDPPDLCFQCHDGIAEMLETGTHVHYAAEDSCTNCHNPHNAKYKKLLLDAMPQLCFDCHDDIGEIATTSAVQHGALTTGDSCAGCHNPHASEVEKLLRQLPYDLCIGCHNVDTITDDTGKQLVNIKALIDNNPEKHGPVAAKDCTACHQPHGGDPFRMLIMEYPAKFYSPFDPANYELCFTCHDDRMVTTAETTTLTGFRRGSRNLHFVHVNRETRGRTCRACHEVHAAENVHIIRDSVPYGKSGWKLPLNYEPRPNGGACLKTCHPAREYDRTTGDDTSHEVASGE